MINEARALAESLRHANKARVVAGPTAVIATMLKRRFAKQRKGVKRRLAELEPMIHGAPQSAPAGLNHAIIGGIGDAANYSPRFMSSLEQAYRGAAGIAAAQLGLEEDPSDEIDGPTFEHSFTLMAIDGTTQKELLDVVTGALALGYVYAAVAAAVDTYFDRSEESRAEQIAVTEVADAFSQGMLDTAEWARDTLSMTVEKAWIPEDDPCPICEANSEQGFISDEEDFDSGDDSPPAHPNCRCSIDVRVKEE